MGPSGLTQNNPFLSLPTGEQSQRSIFGFFYISSDLATHCPAAILLVSFGSMANPIFLFGEQVGFWCVCCGSLLGLEFEMLVDWRLTVMAIEEEKQEQDDKAIFGEGLSAEGIDPEFLSYLEESQNEFEGWLERVRNRREKSISVLDEVRGDLGRSQSWLENISVEQGANNSPE